MKIRRLQRLDEHQAWHDDAYVFENDAGQVAFCYNLTWERVGARYNQQFAETGIALEAVEQVLPLDGQTMRWLPVEVIDRDQVEAYLADLDARCAIPQPRPIAVTESLATE